MYKHILIATDGSEHSAKGVEEGVALAKAVGAKLTVLNVSEPFPNYDLVSSLGIYQNKEAIASYEDGCKRLADIALGQAKEAATAAGISCDTLHVPDRAPAAGILDTAQSLGVDLIVVSSHGRSGFERFVLGSQAERVVQRAGVSVLVVR